MRFTPYRQATLPVDATTCTVTPSFTLNVEMFQWQRAAVLAVAVNANTDPIISQCLHGLMHVLDLLADECESELNGRFPDPYTTMLDWWDRGCEAVGLEVEES